MTKKNAKKKAARARQELHGGKYQSHLRHEGGADGRSRRAIEVLLFDSDGRNFVDIVTFVPPGLPNGAPDPSEGLLMGSSPTLKPGPYLLVEPTGRARHIVADRSAGGGAYMVRFRAPDSFVALQIIYASKEFDEAGMPKDFARYKVMLDRKRPTSGIYAMGILPLTSGARRQGVHAFGWQAWRELLALLDADHSELSRRIVADVPEAGANAHGEPSAGDNTRATNGRAKRGGMRPLALLLTPDFLATYHAPVADLGVTEVRYTITSAGEIDGLYFFLPGDTPHEKEHALIQRLRERWGDVGIELVVLRHGRTDFSWSWADEDAELRREGERLGIQVTQERSDRWTARIRDGRVAYGLTNAAARARLIHDVRRDEGAWQNQVDDETRPYLDLREDD